MGQNKMKIAFANAKEFSKTQLEETKEFAPNFSAHGLISAIIIDAKTKQVLMLAYMNKQALELSLETGFVHYFSRSRKKLWKKGESSGQVQKLIEIHTDCDQDALLISVEQQGFGAACHTGRKSCFFRKVTISNNKASLKIIGSEPLFDPKKIY